MRIVVDAYAWIEIFIGSEKGRKAQEILGTASYACTPGTVLAEVARKYLREGIDADIVKDRLKIIAEATSIATIDMEAALEAARCYLKLSDEAKRARLRAPSLFDAIVLATAKLDKAKVLTGDEHLKNQSEVIWMG